MELKKNKKYDLEAKSPLFFSIGLIIALALVTAAFEWRSEYTRLDLSAKAPLFDELIMIPITDIPPPAPPSPIPPKAAPPKPATMVVEAAEELPETVKTPILPPDIDLNDLPIDDLPPPEPPRTFEGVVETMPEFPGGKEGFCRYIGEHVKYTPQAERQRISGRVFVSFVIDETGQITEIKVLKGVGAGLDEEVVRVLENAPKWSPGKQRGRPVRFRMVLPISFSLSHF